MRFSHLTATGSDLQTRCARVLVVPASINEPMQIEEIVPSTEEFSRLLDATELQGVTAEDWFALCDKDSMSRGLELNVRATNIAHHMHGGRGVVFRPGFFAGPVVFLGMPKDNGGSDDVPHFVTATADWYEAHPDQCRYIQDYSSILGMSQQGVGSGQPDGPKAVRVPTGMSPGAEAEASDMTRSFAVSYTPTGDLILSGRLRDPDLGQVRYAAVLGQDPATDFAHRIREGNGLDESWDFDDVTGWVSVEGTDHVLDRINAYTSSDRVYIHLDFLIENDERGCPSGNLFVAVLDEGQVVLLGEIGGFEEEGVVDPALKLAAMNAGMSPVEAANLESTGSVADHLDSLRLMGAMRNEPPVPLTLRDQVLVFQDSVVARVEALPARLR